jgi:hypothetical protein
MPAIIKSFLGTGAETIPVPRGAGIKHTQTEPHFPEKQVTKRSKCENTNDDFNNATKLS